MNTSLKMETEVRGNELVLTRILDAPRPLVFKAWADAQHLARWWSPHYFTNTAEVDLRPGGGYRIVMISPTGEQYPVTGTFLEIVEPERLVMTEDTAEHGDEWHRQWREYRNGTGQEPPIKVLVTVLLEEVGTQTKLTVINRFASAEDLEATRKMGMVEGWGQMLEKLDVALLELMPEGAYAFTRLLDGPRSLISEMYTDAALAERWGSHAGCVMKVLKMEKKVGGMLLFSMQLPHGGSFHARHIFLELIAGERIVSIVSFTDAEGNIVPAGAPFGENWPKEGVYIITLSDEDGKTRMTMRGWPINATAEEHAAFQAGFDILNYGYAATYDKFEVELARLRQERGL